MAAVFKVIRRTCSTPIRTASRTNCSGLAQTFSLKSHILPHYKGLRGPSVMILKSSSRSIYSRLQKENNKEHVTSHSVRLGFQEISSRMVNESVCRCHGPRNSRRSSSFDTVSLSGSLLPVSLRVYDRRCRLCFLTLLRQSLGATRPAQSFRPLQLFLRIIVVTQADSPDSWNICYQDN